MSSALSKQDARMAVEIGSMAVGALGFALPHLTARLFGAAKKDVDSGAVETLIRTLGARSLTYGAVLSTLEDDDDAELLLMAGAASASADCVLVLAAASRGRLKAPGAVLIAAISGTLAGLACYAITS